MVKSEQEKAIRKSFLNSFDLPPRVLKYSPQKRDQILHYLYGIYFYDHLSGGRIIRDKWPLLWVSRKTPAANIDTRTIEVPLQAFTDDSGSNKFTWVLGKDSSKSIEFVSTINTYWILIGIEEASHLDFYHLDRSHYNRGKYKDHPTGPLKDLGSRKEILRHPSSFEYQYLLGDEFAANIVVGCYVKNFLPDLWQKHYKAIYQNLISKRKQALRFLSKTSLVHPSSRYFQSNNRP